VCEPPAETPHVKGGLLLSEQFLSEMVQQYQPTVGCVHIPVDIARSHLWRNLTATNNFLSTHGAHSDAESSPDAYRNGGMRAAV
jgi:hypothetical protein